MIPYLDCRAARLLLEAFVDGELSVHDQVALESDLRWCPVCGARVGDVRGIGAPAVSDQVAVESHLRWCSVCAARVDDVQVIGASLRVTSCALRAVDRADD